LAPAPGCRGQPACVALTFADKNPSSRGLGVSPSPDRFAKVHVYGLRAIRVIPPTRSVPIWGTEGRGFKSRQPDTEPAGHGLTRSDCPRLERPCGAEMVPKTLATARRAPLRLDGRTRVRIPSWPWPNCRLPSWFENQRRSIAMLPSGVPALERDEALELLGQLEAALVELRKLRAQGEAMTRAHPRVR
jgi:hypothetical protein